MKVIFYDRKNKQEVSSDQLIKVDLGGYIVTVDENGRGEKAFDPKIYDFFVTRETVAELGYKSKNCPQYNNWDVWLNTNDLVFLRLEE